MSKAAELAALVGSGQAQIASNLIINGSNQIAQRATSSTSSGYQTVDRTRAEFSGASVTQSQQALTSGGPYDDGHRFFFRCANTSTSSATSAYLQINQEIEAQNVATSGWDATSSSSFITMSFWARSSLAGTYNIHLRTHDGTARSFSTTFTLVADTWKKVTATIPGNSGITVTNDNGIGLRCYIIVHYGTNYTSSGHTSDAWQTVDTADLTADFAQNWSNTASATFDMTGWKVEVGEVATPYPHEDFATTLYKCQRYYQVVGDYRGIYTGSRWTSTQIYATYPLACPLRASPSLSTGGAFPVLNKYDVAQSASATALVASAAEAPDAFNTAIVLVWTLTAYTPVANNVYQVSHNGATTFVVVDSEL
tara:strand:- start:223 stop:1323 length:1101 start_codon:yes stop_codon:yes gene_type:complete